MCRYSGPSAYQDSGFRIQDSGPSAYQNDIRVCSSGLRFYLGFVRLKFGSRFGREWLRMKPADTEFGLVCPGAAAAPSDLCNSL